MKVAWRSSDKWHTLGFGYSSFCHFSSIICQTLNKHFVHPGLSFTLQMLRTLFTLYVILCWKGASIDKKLQHSSPCCGFGPGIIITSWYDEDWDAESQWLHLCSSFPPAPMSVTTWFLLDFASASTEGVCDKAVSIFRNKQSSAFPPWTRQEPTLRWRFVI